MNNDNIDNKDNICLRRQLPSAESASKKKLFKLSWL